MDAANSFKYLKSCLVKRLVTSGFVADGDMVSRKVCDTMVVIEIQKDRKYSTKDEIKFTINVGISVDALCKASGGASSQAMPPPERCHWRQRLGYLLPTQSDVWWSVKDEETAQQVCDEVAAGLMDVAWPKVEAMASSDALAHAWLEGRGQGLTEYERRLNLAKLLMALGRKDEAQAAVQALEGASLGKSWAATAAYEVKHLRQQLLG